MFHRISEKKNPTDGLGSRRAASKIQRFPTKAIETIGAGSLCGLVRRFLLEDDPPFVIQFALVPIGAMVQMRLACGRANGDGGLYSLVVGSALVATRGGLSPFGMCHGLGIQKILEFIPTRIRIGFRRVGRGAAKHPGLGCFDVD